MIRSRHKPFLTALAITAAASSAVAADGGPRIDVTDFHARATADGRVTITAAAAGTGGAKVASYCVRIGEGPSGTSTGASPSGFVQVTGLHYLSQDDPAGMASPLLTDNGPRDQDPRAGRFATTVDTRGWDDGRYVLLVAATNRPSSGEYVADSRALAVTVINGRAVRASYPSDLRHGIIYQQIGIYGCFPSLVRLEDGRLATEFGTRTRASHIDFTGGTAKRVSGDGGETWQPFDGPIINPAWRTADGRLVIGDADGWQFTTADQRPRLERAGRYLHETGRPNSIGYLGDAHYRVSADGGEHWTHHAIPLPPDLTSGLMHFHDDTSRLVTRDRVRLAATYGKRRGAGPDEWEVFFVRSPDDGKTWSVVAMTPAGPPHAGLGFNETSLVELQDGQILAMMRTQPEGNLYSSTSADGGMTWGTPTMTPIRGWPCHLLRLSDGRILCTYGWRRAPMGIRARLSSDDGRTWDVEREMVVRADGAGSASDLGYPRAIELPGGRILAVYYMTTDAGPKRVHVAWSRWSLPETNGVPAPGGDR